MEVSPGLGLINVTGFNFPAGGLGHLPEFQELICSIIVSPDLSRGVPKFAMHVISLASTSQEHLDHSAEYYKLPIHGLLTDAKIDRDKVAIDYSDNDGQILQMSNCSPKLDYRNDERYFQAYTMDGDDLTIANCYIESPLFEINNPTVNEELFFTVPENTILLTFTNGIHRRTPFIKNEKERHTFRFLFYDDFSKLDLFKNFFI